MATPSSSILNCLCGNIQVPGSFIAAESFPIDTEMCHCDDCRYVSGALAGTWVPLKSAPASEVLSKAKAYDTSKRNTRYFCPKCGTHCFVNGHTNDDWSAPSRLVEQTTESKDRGETWPKNIVKVTHHSYVGDTKDGGIAKSLATLGGREIPCYPGTEDEKHAMPKEEILKLQQNKPTTKPGKGDKLHAECHCGEVKLDIVRADWSEGEKKWIVPEDHSKYLTGCCFCRSCTLSNGFSIQPWAFIPPENILKPDGQSLQYDSSGSNLNQLTDYKSKNTVTRSFCSTCGTSVLYARSDRMHVVDFSTGLLRADSGAMAKEWLSWALSRAGHGKEAVDSQLLEALLNPA